MNRNFSKAQRLALLEIAGYRCEICGIPLTINTMHADHRIPWSAGGPTDVSNGQALCQPCNLEKHASMKLKKVINKHGQPMEYRNWQLAALLGANGKAGAIKKLADGANHYFINVCPGGGKTPFGVAFSRWALDNDYIERIIVLSPRMKIREQWEDLMKLNGITAETITRTAAIGRTGNANAPKKCIVITYQLFGIPEVVEYVRAITAKYRTLFIADEIHWLGFSDAVDDTRWGDAFRRGSEHARFVLPLSGTPFREDHYKLPFLQYQEGKGSPDYNYSYGEAVRDGAVTPIRFDDHTGIIDFEVTDSDGHVEEVLSMDFDDDHKGWYYTQNGEPDEKKLNRRLSAALQNNSEFWHPIIDAAVLQLNILRNREDPSAGGIIFARDQAHARTIAGYLARTTGNNPRVIISDEDRDIDGFAQSADDWVVSVRMINEGVDIERLRVAVMLTNVTTRKHFMQAVARAIRVNYKLNTPVRGQWAYVFMPADPRFKQYALEFKNAIADQELDPPQGTGGSGGGEKKHYTVNGVDVELGGATFDGNYYSTEEMAEGVREFRQHVDPETWGYMVARLGDVDASLIATQMARKQRKGE